MGLKPIPPVNGQKVGSIMDILSVYHREHRVTDNHLYYHAHLQAF